MDGRIRAMVADRHTAVRTGLRDYLQSDSGLQVVAEAVDAQQTVLLVASERPDVLVLDMSMPGMTCVEVIRKSRQAYPPVRILVLPIVCEDPYVSALLRAGADGCLAKSVDRDQLVRAVKQLAQLATHSEA